MTQKITFQRENLSLAGLLFLPKTFSETSKYNAIIIQGSLTSVKEMMGTTYGERLAAKGFVCLTFDYSHYGESEGEPRQLEDPLEKLKDLQAAVTYLLQQPFVRSVSMLGICTSGGNAMYLAARDRRLKAVATVAGFFPEPELVKTGMLGEEKFNKRIEASRKAWELYKATGENTIVTTYSETDPTAANYAPRTGAYDYYTNPQRGNVPNYRNEISVISFNGFYSDFNPVAEAESVTIPTLIVHSDGCAMPGQAKKVFGMLKGEKQLAWDGGGNHFDYYDSPAQVEYAVEQIALFLGKRIMNVR